jgi:hypothetical protein
MVGSLLWVVWILQEEVIDPHKRISLQDLFISLAEPPPSLTVVSWDIAVTAMEAAPKRFLLTVLTMYPW